MAHVGTSTRQRTPDGAEQRLEMAGSRSSGPDGWHVVLGPEGEVGEVGKVDEVMT